MQDNPYDMSCDLFAVFFDGYVIGPDREQVKLAADIRSPVPAMPGVAHSGACRPEKYTIINARGVPDRMVETFSAFADPVIIGDLGLAEIP